MRTNSTLLYVVGSWVLALGTFYAFSHMYVPTNELIPTACTLAAVVALFSWLVLYSAPKSFAGCTGLLLNSLAVSQVSVALVVAGFVEQAHRALPPNHGTTATPAEATFALMSLGYTSLKIMPVLIALEIACLVITILTYAFAHIRLERSLLRTKSDDVDQD